MSNNQGGSCAPSCLKWIAALGVLALAIVGYMSLSADDSQESAIRGHLAALRDNRVSEAYYQFSTPDFEQTVPLQDFQEYIETYPEFLGNKGIEFVEKTTDEGNATLKGNMLTKDDQKVLISYTLVKHGDSWKIQGIDILEVPGEATAAPTSQGATGTL